MPIFYWAIDLVLAQRLVELWIARRNTARLCAEGGYEVGAEHYPLIVFGHVAWFVGMLLFIPGDADPTWPLLGLYGLLQLFRIWVMVSLGRYWTTRIIVVPNAPLVRRGPYRFMKHPNYLLILAELFVLPAAFGAWWLGLALAVLNAAILTIRIRTEEATFQTRQAASAP